MHYISRGSYYEEDRSLSRSRSKSKRSPSKDTDQFVKPINLNNDIVRIQEEVMAEEKKSEERVKKLYEKDKHNIQTISKFRPV